MHRGLRAGFAALALGCVGGPAFGVTLFHETFDGYTAFPAQQPVGDAVNPGLAKVAEGASETWYGVRFEQTGCFSNCTPKEGTASSIDGDLFVQRYGDSFNGQGPGNQTPVGRFEDDAGLILQISTVGFTDALLSFDWRTFATDRADEVVVGYFASDTPIAFTSHGGSGYLDARSTGPNPGLSWGHWTELMRDGQQASFASESFALPDDVAYLYVAFWLDDGEGDYGKLDNVRITANAVPEPSALALLALAAAVRAARLRRV